MRFLVVTLATAIDPVMVVIALLGSLVPRTLVGALMCALGSGCLYHGMLGAVGDGQSFFDAGLASAVAAAAILTVPAMWVRLVSRHQRDLKPHRPGAPRT